MLMMLLSVVGLYELKTIKDVCSSCALIRSRVYVTIQAEFLTAQGYVLLSPTTATVTENVTAATVSAWWHHNSIVTFWSLILAF